MSIESQVSAANFYASLSNLGRQMQTNVDNIASFAADSIALEIPSINIGEIVELFGEDIPTVWTGQIWDIGAQISAAAAEYDLSVTTLVSQTPAAPVLGEVSSVDVPVVTELSATAPQVEIPTAPVLQTLTMPTAPVLADQVMPDAPVVAIPTIPELADLNIPSISTISIPVFTKVFPEVPDGLAVPDGVFEYSEEEYSSPELTALTTLLQDDIANGGWGVTHADEEDLFNREVDRETMSAVAAEDGLLDTFSSRGFDLPIGELVSEMDKLHQQTQNKLSEINRDVSIQRADLIRKSREFSVTQMNDLVGKLITHFGFVKQRALEAAKTEAEFGMRVFNAALDLYNMRAQSYNMYAQVYEAKIRALIAGLEAEKIQLEAEALKSEINKDQIAIYTAQIQASSLAIQIYNTQMEGAKIRSDIERNKLLVFNAQVDAHKAEIQAQMASIQVYDSRLNAERTKVDIYRTEVDAHESEVRAAKLRSDTQVNIARLDIEEQKVVLAQYDARLSTYKAQLAAEETRGRLELGNIEGKIRGLSVYGDLETARLNTESSNSRAIADVSATRADVVLAAQKARSAVSESVAKMQLDATTKAGALHAEYSKAVTTGLSQIDVSIS